MLMIKLERVTAILGQLLLVQVERGDLHVGHFGVLTRVHITHTPDAENPDFHALSLSRRHVLTLLGLHARMNLWKSSCAW